MRTGAGGEWLRVGPVKLFSDGALGSRTAHLLEPYEGRQADGYRGVPTLEPEELEADMRLAADAKLDVAVHAIGDAAVRAVLDAYEKTRATYPPMAERMLRIEHAQLVHPDDVPRFARLGVVASMQPIHATADWRAADAHWGRRARHAYAWRDLLVVLRRMEARGEIRGGRFVSGFVGEQFARPEALDLLRHIRRSGTSGEEVEIALADPLNLTGIVLPGPRTSALAQGALRLRDGIVEEALFAALPPAATA